MTKQAAIRAINEAKTADDLRTVLLAMVDKLAWPIEMPNGVRTIEPPVRI